MLYIDFASLKYRFLYLMFLVWLDSTSGMRKGLSAPRPVEDKFSSNPTGTENLERLQWAGKLSTTYPDTTVCDPLGVVPSMINLVVVVVVARGEVEFCKAVPLKLFPNPVTLKASA